MTKLQKELGEVFKVSTFLKEWDDSIVTSTDLQSNYDRMSAIHSYEVRKLRGSSRMLEKDLRLLEKSLRVPKRLPPLSIRIMRLLLRIFRP